MSSEKKTHLVQQLQEVLQSTSQLEGALAAEKQKNKRIAQEYVQVRGQLEELVKKIKNESLKKDSEINSLQKILEGVRTNENLLHQKNLQFTGQLQKAKGVIHEQTLVIEKLEKQNSSFNVLSTRNEELEAAVRTLSAKTRDLQQNQLDQQHEIQTAILAAKEQYRTLLKNEANKIKESIQAEARAEVKKAKSNLDRIFKVELDRITAARQIENQRANDLIHRANSELKIALESQERYRLRLQDTVNELENQKSLVTQAEALTLKIDEAYQNSQAALLEMRNSLQDQDQTFSMLKLEKQKAETHAEEFLRDASKRQLIERLKYEAEIASLKSRLEQMESTRILIEKVDRATDGALDGPVLVAEPDQEMRH
jgi:hypothetical protein